MEMWDLSADLLQPVIQQIDWFLCDQLIVSVKTPVSEPACVCVLDEIKCKQHVNP